MPTTTFRKAKSRFSAGWAIGHKAFFAGVSVTMLDTSNVGVMLEKTGTNVKLGVKIVGVYAGEEITVGVEVGDIVSVDGTETTVWVASDTQAFTANPIAKITRRYFFINHRFLFG
jgi:hypothetical protein